ncbi:MAG: MlaD family protein [Gaiellaceae bacterium]
MRRIVIAGLLVLLAASGAVMTAARQGGGGKTYRVDAIFDNAGFLISGQDVKVAGAKVGQVVGVHVTPDRKARVQMEVAEGFAPFRSDADCIIRPQSLIGEKFVDCSPGSVRGKPLAATGGHAPTVPVSNTHSPVDLDLVFDALRLPVRQRLALVVNELGTGLVGRPRELSAAILRANPALQQARRVLAILDSDRARLGKLIDGSDRILAALTTRRQDISGFIERADQVAQSVASKRGDLGTAVDRLPPLLARLQPAANELGGLVREGRPLVTNLRPAAQPLYELLGDFKPLSDAAAPVVKGLDRLSTSGRHLAKAVMPSVQLLKPITHTAMPTVKQSADLLDSLRDRGVVENILSYIYYGAGALARFDKYSHMLPSYQLQGVCQQYATKPVKGCSAKFNDASGGSQGTASSKALDYLLGK